MLRRCAFLSYLNLREAFLSTPGVLSVLAVGYGRGYAELALPLGYPNVHFHLTDIAPNYEKSMQLVDLWKINNVTFDVRDILQPEQGRYDLVTSIEVLEHIEHDRWAAAEMRAAANRYVFALTSFADKSTSAAEDVRPKHKSDHEQYRVGYDEDDFRRLFPGAVQTRCCFWSSGGLLWRRRLEALSNQETIDSQDELERAATADQRPQVPRRRSQGCGIWLLARV